MDAASSSKKKSSKSVSWAMDTASEAGGPSHSSNSPSNSSGPFSSRTREQAKNFSKNLCWACGRTDPDAAHVIAKEDVQQQLWLDQSLIDFHLTSVENAIALCKSCHGDFDRWTDLRLIFFPTDLQFFIDFEIERREKTGVDEGRRVPTANEYKDHQVRQGQVVDTEIGGWYKIVELSPAYPEGPTRLKEKNTWHGSPVASLRRAFHALGSPRIKTALTTTEIANLRTLMDLYFEPTTVDDQSSETPGESGPIAASEKRKHDDEDDEDESTDRKGKAVSSKKGKYEQGIPIPKYNLRARYPEVPGKTWCPDFHHWVNASWQFGPGATAKDIIEKASISH